MSTLLLIDCAVCKQTDVALSGVFLVEVPERGDTLCRLLARTADLDVFSFLHPLTDLYNLFQLVKS